MSNIKIRYCAMEDLSCMLPLMEQLGYRSSEDRKIDHYYEVIAKKK
ncbi:MULTISPECIES: hypothetical protein [unclassified Candidatus Tisiphia]